MGFGVLGPQRGASAVLQMRVQNRAFWHTLELFLGVGDRTTTMLMVFWQLLMCCCLSIEPESSGFL